MNKKNYIRLLEEDNDRLSKKIRDLQQELKEKDPMYKMVEEAKRALSKDMLIPIVGLKDQLIFDGLKNYGKMVDPKNGKATGYGLTDE